MKTILPASIFAGLTSLIVVAAGCAPAQPVVPSPISELAGRTAGAPQQCVPMRQAQSLRIADPQTVIYGSGRTIWVNRLASSCPGADHMDILIVEPLGTQYCRGDRVRTLDAASRIPGPACLLGDFVPYSR